MNLSKKQLVIITLISAILVGILTYILYVTSLKQSQSAVKEPTYTIDKASGEQIEVGDSGRTPENYDTTSSNPYILGTAYLYTLGLRDDDISYIRGNFNNYFPTVEGYKPGDKVSVYRDSISQHINDDSSVDYEFKVLYKDTTDYSVKLHTDGFESHSMEIFSADGKLLQKWDS